MSSLHMNEETGKVISADEYFRDCLASISTVLENN
jgi:hypothetical protein